MGIFDKLTGRKEKAPAKPEAEQATADLVRWTANLFQQFQPENLRLQPGETIGQAMARILDAEEKQVRFGSDNPLMQSLKLAGIAKVRREFGIAEPSGEAAQPTKESPLSEERQDRPAEATFDFVMGGIAELTEVPLGSLVRLVQSWVLVVDTLGKAARLPEELRAEYVRVYVTVEPGEKQPEVVAHFRGARDMIHVFMQELRKLGLVTD